MSVYNMLYMYGLDWLYIFTYLYYNKDARAVTN